MRAKDFAGVFDWRNLALPQNCQSRIRDFYLQFKIHANNLALVYLATGFTVSVCFASIL